MKFFALVMLFVSNSWAWRLEVLDTTDKVVASVEAKAKKASFKPFPGTTCDAEEGAKEVSLVCKDVNGSSEATADCRDKTNNQSTALSINNPEKMEESRVVRVNCKDPKIKTKTTIQINR